jgi:FtsP/CotA-like multicopper oxidase with cupredoxin domain
MEVAMAEWGWNGRGLGVLFAVVCSGLSLTDAFAAPPEGVERIGINDNRQASGTLADGILTVHLAVQQGRWFPDGPDRPGIVVRAFGVEGAPLRIPGPLLRVPEGTRIHAIVRNGLEQPLAVHGLHARPAPGQDASPPTIVPPGADREFSFVARAPGTYFYCAATDPAAAINQRTAADTQLTGGFIVDAKGTPAMRDRVLLIGGWSNVDTGILARGAGQRLRWVINGLSWPGTERFTYQVDDTARIRVINASFGVHPMHLHGFYFRVDSRGDEQQDAIFDPSGSPRLVVTERLAIGRTLSLTWTPTRPGNWPFHCHDSAHLDYGGSLDTLAAPPNDGHHHVETSELDMMSGPVMGITVSGPAPRVTEGPVVARRHLRLVARIDAGSTDGEPAYGYTLGPAAATTSQPYLPGPTLVLKRGEPVDVTVVNQLSKPTAVHWHRIELESYYDGVPGFAGDATRTAPMIPPGGSFDALFTPPRSGTFIYHEHMDDRRQQQAGLFGPLLVVDAPDQYDPAHDLVFLITAPRNAADAASVLVNGSLTPSAKEVHVGEHYRVRLIDLHTARPNMRMRLLAGTNFLMWRGLAKDGMDLPNDQRRDGPAEFRWATGRPTTSSSCRPASVTHDLK